MLPRADVTLDMYLSSIGGGAEVVSSLSDMFSGSCFSLADRLVGFGVSLAPWRLSVSQGVR